VCRRVVALPERTLVGAIRRKGECRRRWARDGKSGSVWHKAGRANYVGQRTQGIQLDGGWRPSLGRNTPLGMESCGPVRNLKGEIFFFGVERNL
jgi:hypothetical protein